jgi:hypothetical protein
MRALSFSMMNNSALAHRVHTSSVEGSAEQYRHNASGALIVDTPFDGRGPRGSALPAGRHRVWVRSSRTIASPALSMGPGGSQL